jgi:hypothetical protein
MDTLSIKKGDTFTALCQRVDSNGTPVNISGYTITSRVRSIGGFSEALTVVVVTPSIGQFSLNATSTATASWPVCKAIDGAVTEKNFLYCDVQYLNGATVESSETFTLQVFEDVTT